MADTTTELEVLDEIVDVLGGQSGQYETVVPVLQQIKELLASGGTVADGSITTAKLANGAVTNAKLADDAVYTDNISNGSVTIDKINDSAKTELASDILYAADATTAQMLAVLGFTVTVLTPQDAYSTSSPHMNIRSRLCWIDTTSGYLEKAPIDFSGNLQSQTLTLWAKGLFSKATGVLGVDDSWTVTSL